MSDSTESPSTHRMPRLSGEDILAGQEDCFQPLAADRQARVSAAGWAGTSSLM